MRETLTACTVGWVWDGVDRLVTFSSMAMPVDRALEIIYCWHRKITKNCMVEIKEGLKCRKCKGTLES